MHKKMGIVNFIALSHLFVVGSQRIGTLIEKTHCLGSTEKNFVDLIFLNDPAEIFADVFPYLSI